MNRTQLSSGPTAAPLRPIHPFPARMAPSIAQRRLKSGRKLRVLDPMAGSGTTVVAARLYGHQAIGFDTDPLALIIAKAWSSDVNPKQIRRLAEQILRQAQQRYRHLRAGSSYPRGSDRETRAFARFWFDPTNRRQLKALSDEIRKAKNPTQRAILWSSFSRLIITKDAGASRARDVSHSRPHRTFAIAPVRPFEHFLSAVDRVLRASHFTSASKLPAATIQRADARDLPLANNSVDLVITSPPYVNAIDYLRGHKLSLIWMGPSVGDLRAIRSHNIGSEVSRYTNPDLDQVSCALKSMCAPNELSARSRGMLARYVHDMDSVFSETSRVLKDRGEAVFVVGNSTIRGVFVRNSAALTILADAHGLTLQSARRRPLRENRRYLPPPGSKDSGKFLRSRMREEVILSFAKRRIPKKLEQSR
jgi:hypothetical protein